MMTSKTNEKEKEWSYKLIMNFNKWKKEDLNDEYNAEMFTTAVHGGKVFATE